MGYLFYRELLSNEYIESLSENFFAGKNKQLIKEDMGKLRANRKSKERGRQVKTT